MDNKEYFGCSRGNAGKEKKPYNTKTTANKALKRMTRNGCATAMLSAYKCEYCGKWHLGNGSRS